MFENCTIKYNKDLITNENCSIQVICPDTTLSVPLDPDNTDYQNILKWVEEGNTIEEAD